MQHTITNPRQIINTLERIMRDTSAERNTHIAAAGIYRAWLRSSTSVAMQLSALSDDEVPRFVTTIADQLTESGTIDNAMYLTIAQLDALA